MNRSSLLFAQLEKYKETVFKTCLQLPFVLVKPQHMSPCFCLTAFSFFVCLFVLTVKPTLFPVKGVVQELETYSALLDVTVADPVNPQLTNSSFTWTFPNGSKVDARFVQENGSLLLTNIEPGLTGNYSCTAVNDGGEGSTTVRLEVLGMEF